MISRKVLDDLLPKKAVAYYRVSTAKQADDERHGLQRQRELCRTFAKEKDYDMVREYDELYTGTEMAARPRLAEMIVFLSGRDDVKIVLVECADRIARDLQVSELIYSEMVKLGVEIITVDTGISFGKDTSPSRVLIRQLLGAVAEFNKSQLVARLAAARAAKTAAGGRGVGRKRYGETPEEALVLDLAIRGAKAGHSRRAIAEIISGQGYRNSRGSEWTARSVSRLLSRRRPDPVDPQPGAL